MRNLYCLMVLLVIIWTSCQKITLDQLMSLDKEELSDGDLVQVVEFAETRSISSLQRDYYVIQVIHREKRKAYEHMNVLFDKVVGILKKHNIIPHQNGLVKSKIKPKYLIKKRMWSFSTIFVIYGNSNELQKCNKELTRFGIQKLMTKPSINFLNEKILALEIFSSAKVKLERELSRFGTFKIKQIQDIELQGYQIFNSEIIQNQIQQEFSESEQIIEENQIKENSNKQTKESLKIRIVFRVSRKELDSEDESYQEAQVEENSEFSNNDTEGESM